jgi:exopolysaccharide biosynthesis polyprenyl glycosylphosphotransferase
MDALSAERREIRGALQRRNPKSGKDEMAYHALRRGLRGDGPASGLDTSLLDPVVQHDGTMTLDLRAGNGVGPLADATGPPPAAWRTIAPRPRRPTALGRRLRAWDATAITLAWAAVLAVLRRPGPRWPWAAVEMLASVALTMAALHLLRLYRGQVCLDRRRARIRLAVASASPAAPLAAAVPFPVPAESAVIVVGCLTAFFCLVVEREVFEQWLRAQRVRGRCLRPVLLAGDAEEVRLMAGLLDAHPETGCRPLGYVGRTARGDEPGHPGLLRLGPVDDVVAVALAHRATAVLAGPSVLASARLTACARELNHHGVLVQAWSGLWGVDPRRLRTVRLAHEAFFDLRPAASQARLGWLKRLMDVLGATVALVVTAPLLALAALLIRLHDGGPVLFRQRRVGLHGEEFELRKLRTMSVDAEARLGDLQAANERAGPLFKVKDDPRVTPVGRILRATSLDELPQLIDVLAGRLSLVGPRPALPSEVAEFDRALLSRHDVLPGITGLWQVEARHNPSFFAYRHLDLYYVENWNLQLDVVILLATVKTVIADTIEAVARAWRARHVKEREL